jgi:multidrug resistance efflux pump
MSCPHGVWHDKDCELCTLDNERFEWKDRAEKAEAEIKQLKAENVRLQALLDAEPIQITRLKSQLAQWEANYERWKGEGAFG